MDALKDLENYKWYAMVIGPLLFIFKSWIENSDNNALEKILNSKLTSFYNDLFLFIIAYITFLTVLIIGPTNEVTDISKNKITLFAVLLFDFIISLAGFFIAKIAIYFIDTKYDYYVLFNENESNDEEKLEWRLIKNSGKIGYMIKNRDGVIDFIKDISNVKFKEVKIIKKKKIGIKKDGSSDNMTIDKNLDPIKRLEYNHYAIDKSLERLKDALSRAIEKELYLEIGNLLLWVLTTDEWHCKNNTPGYTDRKKVDSKGILLFGLRHAYNLIKHDMKCIQLHRNHVESKLTFPLEIPEEGFELGSIQVLWEENKEFKGYDNQKKIYLEQMNGKYVLLAFEEAIQFLQNEKQYYLK